MLDRAFGNSGSQVVIEEFLTGPEVSVLAFTDGKTVVPMVSSMDHKQMCIRDRVATVAINGAKNAAVLAAQILAVSDEALAETLAAQRVEMAQQIAAKEARLQAELSC